MKEIEITINTDGTLELDLKGYNGNGCSKITDELVKALKGDVINRDQKHEYYKPEVKTKVKQRI